MNVNIGTVELKAFYILTKFWKDQHSFKSGAILILPFGPLIILFP